MDAVVYRTTRVGEHPCTYVRAVIDDFCCMVDVMRVVAALAPYVPLLGLLSGGETVATHVMNRKGVAKK